jgi:hypothetical protein
MIAALGSNIEPFVTADVVAEFLCITRRRVLEMARSGTIPAHPIGQGKRKQWRFRLYLSDFRWPPKYLRSRERHRNHGWKSWVQESTQRGAKLRARHDRIVATLTTKFAEWRISSCIEQLRRAGAGGLVLDTEQS